MRYIVYSENDEIPKNKQPNYYKRFVRKNPNDDSPNYQHKLHIYNPYYVQHTQNYHFLFHLFPDVMKNDVPNSLNYLL